MNTGAIKSPEDKRDIQIGKIEISVKLPEEYLPDYSGFSIYYQNGQPACGGHSGAKAKEILDYFDTGEIKEYSPRFVYACCKFLDGMPYSGGTYLRAIGDTLKKYGACDMSLYPNDISLSLEDYKNFNNISEEAFENAQERIISAYGFTGTGWEDIKQSIYKHKLVLLLVCPFLQGYSDGHFVVATGWDKNNRIRYINSFGKDWGENGWSWLEQDSFQEIQEGMTMIDIKNSTIKNLTSQITLLRKVVELLLKLKSLLK
jgi:hypothetical protein